MSARVMNKKSGRMLSEKEKRSGRPLSEKEKKWWGRGFLLFLLVFWQILSMIVGKSYLLPSPLDVLLSLWENKKELFLVHLPSTLSVMGLGLLFSVLLGSLLAIVMDLDERIEKTLYPILTVTQTIPVMCIAPVFVLWFGYTLKMRVVVVILVNFFSVTVNLFDGFKSTKQGRTELLMTYGASKVQQFRLLRLPTALPYFFTAMHVALPWSCVGAAVAEWLGAPSGLGTFSKSCMMSLDAPGLLAPLVLITFIALLGNTLLHLLEKRFTAGREDA